MLQEVNLDVRLGNGCSIPVGKDIESLVFLQTSYNFTCGNEFAKRIIQFWPPNTSKQGAGECFSSKVVPVTELCN